MTLERAQSFHDIIDWRVAVFNVVYLFAPLDISTIIYPSLQIVVFKSFLLVDIRYSNGSCR